MRIAATVALILHAAAGPLLAATVAETASGWGLTGSWMPDCRKPATSGNPVVRYVVDGDKLFYGNDAGGGRATDANQVTAATTQADGSIVIAIHFGAILPAQNRQLSIVKGHDGRIRVMSNSNIDSKEYSIANGTLIASGDATPWLTRCQ